MTGQMKAVVGSEVKVQWELRGIGTDELNLPALAVTSNSDLPGDCLDPPGPGSPRKIGHWLVTPPRRRVEA